MCLIQEPRNLFGPASEAVCYALQPTEDPSVLHSHHQPVVTYSGSFPQFAPLAHHVPARLLQMCPIILWVGHLISIRDKVRCQATICIRHYYN